MPEKNPAVLDYLSHRLSYPAKVMTGPAPSRAELEPILTAALRVPDHPVAQAILRAAWTPIAAPSANRSGRVSPTNAEHVAGDLDGRVARARGELGRPHARPDTHAAGVRERAIGERAWMLLSCYGKLMAGPCSGSSVSALACGEQRELVRQVRAVQNLQR